MENNKKNLHTMANRKIGRGRVGFGNISANKLKYVFSLWQQQSETCRVSCSVIDNIKEKLCNILNFNQCLEREIS